MFYQKDIQDIFKELHTSIQGLTQQEASRRLQQYGPHLIKNKSHDHPIIIFIKQFQDFLVLILIIAAIISGFSHQWESTLVIIVVIVMNALLGTIQTLKAEKSLESLQKLSVPHVKVMRDGCLHQIDASQLTIGDIVLLDAGDIVSGDGRLIECSALKINESALTGEVESVDKTAETMHHKAILSDQKNMVFSGSLVTNGTGYYVVTHIGMKTEIGKIAALLNDSQERKTPLQRKLDEFSQQLSIGIILISIIVFLFHFFLAKHSLLESMMIAVALAVAAIPEALGSIVTIVLSISTQQMVHENAIIKNLNSVESLGCVSIICSDKTGTLTQNKMTPQHIYFYQKNISLLELNSHNHDHNVLLKACLLCNNATIQNGQRIGDPTELALIDLVHTYTQHDHQFQNTAIRQYELPFDSKRKLMSVSSFHHIYTKGAVDILLQRCDTLLINGRKETLSLRHQKTILQENQNCAKKGLRVLGFAYKNINHSKITLQDENHLTFIGLVTLMDPPRLESYEAIQQCQQAGIIPIMITGDHIMTAQSIAQMLGIYHDGDLAIEGHQLDHMSEEELDQKVPSIRVYARVTPEHKLRIIKAWQKRGEIVAMTGDGVNDAPALKQSDIGVAMGMSGSEVAKDAAHMILTDDNFSTIVKAVMTGRHVYQNIKNAINYLLSGNLAGIICVLLSSCLLLPTPFYPVHLLFMNLITDSLPAIAIGMEKNHQDILNEKPRRAQESLFSKKTLLQMCYEGLIIAICTMCSYLMGLKGSALKASTMAFATICLARLLHGFNCRSEQSLISIGIFTNKATLYAFIIGWLFLHLILFVPILQPLFMIQSLSIVQLILVYAFAFIPTLMIQIRKTM